MTTLPQTTPMRAPRPNGNGHLAMPSIIAPSQAPSANTLTGADVWRVIRANTWLILLTLMAAAIVGYLANMILLAKAPHYTSIGLLTVRTPSDMPTSVFEASRGTDPAGLEIEQRTQQESLTNDTLLTAVLSKSEAIRDTSWFKQFVTFKNGAQEVNAQAAKQSLHEHMDVIPVTNSRLIRVQMTYSVPKDCKIIVQEICDQHINDARLRQSTDQMEHIKALDTLKDTYNGQIIALNGAINAIGSQLAKFGISPTNGGGTKQVELTYYLDARKEADLQKNTYANRLKAFKEAMATGTSYELLAYRATDGRYQSLKSQVSELEDLADEYTIRLGEKNELTLSANRRLKVKRKELDDLEAIMVDTVQRQYEGQYQTGLATATEGLKDIDESIKKLLAEIADLSSKEHELQNKMRDLQVVQAKFDHVTDELAKSSTTSNSTRWNVVDWSTLPNLPDYPSFPRLPIVMSLAMVLGLGLSVGIAFLREMTDTTVRSPRDIARVGQMTLLGMIPHQDDDPQLSGARLPLAIYEAPHSMIAEQFRQVRTRMQHAASLDTTRSILVTGCSPGDGKTVVAINIAAGLALNGRRILLIDANFRRPNLHSVFTVGNEAGFGDVLNAPEMFDECVRTTEVPNLSIMTSGTRPSNPTELLESQLLVDFIERALEEYDHVIFDSGPLLMVSDSIALAPRVDGVITVVRARGNSRGLLQRVRDELRRLKAEHLGVVLNAFRVQGGGYYGPMIKDYYAYQNQ